MRDGKHKSSSLRGMNKHFAIDGEIRAVDRAIPDFVVALALTMETAVSRLQQLLYVASEARHGRLSVLQA